MSNPKEVESVPEPAKGVEPSERPRGFRQAQPPSWLDPRLALACGFILAHALVIWRVFAHRAHILGDVGLYEWWARGGLGGNGWPVLDFDWVYPAGALVPVTLPALTGAYDVAWIAMIVALNAAAVAWLASLGQRGRAAAWWWLAFLVALGPIWLGRLEGVIAPIMVVALAEAARRPALAVALATFGAWIKIAPGAIVVAIAAASRSARGLVRNVVVPGLAVSAAVVGLALAGGAGTRALSVFGEHTGRGLQAESVAATWFSVARLWNPDVRFQYNTEIFTFEVVGAGADGIASALDALLILAVVGIAFLTWRAARGGPERAHEALLLSAAATITALIVFNKVGSPQFIAWLAPPVVAALATQKEVSTGGASFDWRPAAIGLIAVGALTHLIYPIYYDAFILGNAAMISVGALRNASLVVGLVWLTTRLASEARAAARPAFTWTRQP